MEKEFKARGQRLRAIADEIDKLEKERDEFTQAHFLKLIPLRNEQSRLNIENARAMRQSLGR